MTAVYPLLNHTDNDFKELRYSLRSLAKFNPVDQVIIVGGNPRWIKNVTHIPYKDYPTPSKAKNIYDKINKAFELVDQILFFNDDHFILAPVDYLHHKGPMIDVIKSRDPHGSYTLTLKNTFDAFYPGIYDFDTHCPIYYDRDRFKKLETLNWNKDWGYGIKSSYCAINNLQGDYYPDLKFSHAIGDITDRLYFTTDDNCDLTKLQDIYPEKSIYEN